MRRGAIIGIVAGAVVLILAWYLLLFSPTSSDLSKTRGEVAAAQSEKQELENTIRQLTELSKNATQQAATLNQLKAAIPATPDLGGFILSANEIASTAGIDFLSIAPSPPVASLGGQNSTIAVSIQVDGGFFQVLDYLNRLEDLPRLVIVDSISVSSSANGAGTSGGTGSSGSADSVDITGGAPDLSVTLSGRMFTTAAAPAATGSAGGSTAGGTTTTPTPTTPTTPTTPSTSGSGAT